MNENPKGPILKGRRYLAWASAIIALALLANMEASILRHSGLGVMTVQLWGLLQLGALAAFAILLKRKLLERQAGPGK